MAWKKESDDAAFDPRVLAVLEHPEADHRTVNEVWGFFSRMTAEIAGHPGEHDHVATAGTCLALAGHNRAELDRLWDLCEFAGLGSVVDLGRGRRGFRMVNDPDFVHVKTGPEVDFERQRKLDNSNPELTVLVRMRDGDACRYCGMVVWFGTRKGDKRGTYDHRPPGRPGSAETSVVACGACNSGRGGLSKGLPPDEGLRVADDRYPLLPAPEVPYFTPSTREWLGRYVQLLGQHGLTPPAPAQEDEIPLKPGTQAPGAAAALEQGARRTKGDAPQQIPADPVGRHRRSGAVPADPGRSRQIPSLPVPDPPGRDGTGQDGLGREGKERAAPRRRRGRRGGRGRGMPGSKEDR